MRSNSPSPANGSEHLLRQAASNLTPNAGAQARVKRMIRAQLRAPHLLNQVREELTPSSGLIRDLWSHVLSSIDPIRHLTLWERLRGTLRPAAGARELLWSRFSVRLEPSYARYVASRPVKWVAAFAIVLVAARVSPLLFLAPASIAVSPVTLFAPEGQVEVLLGSLWQPITGEVTLNSPTRLQTQKGRATIVTHDDAVFRFAPSTRGQLVDLSDRPESSVQETTVALEEGELWVLGLVPKHVRAITVLTSQGRVFIHEGSVSIKQSPTEVVIRVLDRSALVSRHGHQISLVAGEQTVLSGENEPVATKMDSSVFQEAWVAGNLSRDAAHQREIAQLQQERRAGAAGILPGSRLYPVKRLAETVDVLFSLSEEERARKLITQANTRLNEAAAMISSGGTQAAEDALQEYKNTLLQVASGSGGNAVVQSLLQTEVVDAGPATVAAALPGDPSYALKLAVDDTIAALPSTVTKPDVEGEALIDQLIVAKRQAEQGDTEHAKETLSELSDSIALLDSTGALNLVAPDVRHEAKAVVQQVAAAVEGPVLGIGLTLGVPEKDLVLPQHPSRTVLIRSLTPQQVIAKAQEIRGRIFVFGTKKARYDALEDQMRLLLNHPDRGRILRELGKSLPRDGLAQRVTREIRAVTEEVQMQVTASGGTAPAAQ